MEGAEHKADERYDEAARIEWVSAMWPMNGAAIAPPPMAMTMCAEPGWRQAATNRELAAACEVKRYWPTFGGKTSR
jgi:hypothetical protein